MIDIERVTIVGAGAMGCLFAARLAESGVAVALVEADMARIDAINRDGILLDDDQGQRIVRVPATTSETAAATDLVMLFTKGMHTEKAIHSVAHLAANGALAMTLQNGLGNAEQIAEVFPEGKVLIGATDLPADLQPLTSVSSHGSGTIWLGGFREKGAEGARAVTALFRKAGMSAVHDDGVLNPSGKRPRSTRRSIPWRRSPKAASVRLTASMDGNWHSPLSPRQSIRPRQMG
jgi:2-dehydropantoate 2-reductase